MNNRFLFGFTFAAIVLTIMCGPWLVYELASSQSPNYTPPRGQGYSFAIAGVLCIGSVSFALGCALWPVYKSIRQNKKP